MIISTVKNEMSRVATALDSQFEYKNMAELETFVGTFRFKKPLINWIPVTNIPSYVGKNGRLMYTLNCKIQFLTKAKTHDNLEHNKDDFNDEMIALNQNFIHELYSDQYNIFNNTDWKSNITVVRPFKTSSFLVGVENSLSLQVDSVNICQLNQ